MLEQKDVRKKRLGRQSQPRSRSRTRQTRCPCFRCRNAHHAKLEARLSAETERRKREHAANEMEAVKKQVRDRYLQFASVTAGLREATEMAVVIVPETREFNELLEVIDAEVAKAIDGLSGDLDQRIEALRAGPEMPQALNGSPELQQNNDRVILFLV